MHPSNTINCETATLTIWLVLFQNCNRVQVRRAKDEKSCQSNGTAELQSQPAAGTCTSSIREKLSWPLSVTRAVCNAPWYLSCRVRFATQAFANHLRGNARDYTLLYELLSMSLPLLFVLQEVLLQMYAEAVPDGPSLLQPVLLWLQEHIEHRVV